MPWDSNWGSVLDWSKRRCVKKPHQRRSWFHRHFLSLKVSLFRETFFNSDAIFQQSIRFRPTLRCLGTATKERQKSAQE